MTAAQPFRLLGEAGSSALGLELLAEVLDWSATWFAEAPQAELKIEAAPAPLDPDRWTVAGEAPERWVAWQSPGDSWREYIRLLLAAPVAPDAARTPLIGSLLDDCLSDLATRLLAAAGMATDGHRPGTEVQRSLRTGYGSGAVVARLGGGLPPLRLALGGEIVTALSGRQEPAAADAALTPRKAAIASGSTRLEVILGEAELTLAELANVSPGDVIRLQAAFREPLTVRTSDGRPILHAHLGTRNGRKAIQIIEKTS